MDKPDSEKRNFKRIPFEALLVLSDEDNNWPCTLIDISLKGLLVESFQLLQSEPGKTFLLELKLGENAVIKMQVAIAHLKDNVIGLMWHEIDLDSLTHLRRLLELNLSDASSHDRELSELG